MTHLKCATRKILIRARIGWEMHSPKLVITQREVVLLSPISLPHSLSFSPLLALSLYL